MTRELLRTYHEFDLEDVKKHLLIVGDLSGDCASCRELGIDPYGATVCPKCGTTFKYISSRRVESHPGERFHIVRRFKQKRPDLTFIDYSDYSKTLGAKQARDFFG
ncbi:MAG: hypothetical protein ACOY3K_05490 [Candidatus Omnitrophota bacterium]